ncbi:hypothetical protein B0I35DRAFT_359977 [Stachybotrys elegans]|uniref:chitinase n=1 Tax=Stachybotrys elegans TaxID=80388 RepID=A0A8K0WLR0_9HYPO|nr:hypothetical protein B0I35DRAFT_359977 [Stachybotrys elegans]
MSRPLLFLLFFVALLHLVDAQTTQCSKDIPCKVGCCSKFGFCGYGKDYCHKDVCVNNCNSKAQCDPGNYGSAFVEQSKCALNVCCSKHGFCGFTDEFCGNKKVKAPSCGSDHRLQRVVGYYEGWAARRQCNSFVPEQIPQGVYTHLNFAFATIDPVTFEIRPASPRDTALYRRLTSLKVLDPDLKVLIAVGGWTFNDPGPTATTFSDLARSEKNQKAFIRSLISLMSTYDFDGIDLDWEYPQAPDRSGRGEDYKNFPKFVANLKRALRSTGGRDEVTLTLPASFWYLQHFDIVALEKHVDFFNIMSYDLHGTWDKTNKWVGPYLNAHTNLTEIRDAMDLLWRNKINPDKVVLGTGFYGRAFTATSPNCLSPGCTYESGAPRQPCSKEISVMIQSEIVDVMKRTGAKPVLNKEAAVKILTFDKNQWVAYDDEETFMMKANFAREQCLSGIMVWAVSQDLKDGTYSYAVGKAAGRRFTSLPLTNGAVIRPPEHGLVEVKPKTPQCKWSNCGEGCPSGWVRMPRKDKGARKGEGMWDDSYCKSGSRRLCCPAEGKVPTCGWYTHRNGKCDPTCPSGTKEVGSLSKHCNNNKYQAACCTTGGESMKLYNQCSWADWPLCMTGKCNNDEVASSPSGSGGALCNVHSFNIRTRAFSVQERKYCCDNDDDNAKWDDCKWYNNLGPGSQDDESFCRSGCPSDRVRVAMDKYWNKDGRLGCARGARAKCCIPKHQKLERRDAPEPPLDAQMRSALRDFLDEPMCDYHSDNFQVLRTRDFNSLAYERTAPGEHLDSPEQLHDHPLETRSQATNVFRQLGSGQVSHFSERAVSPQSDRDLVFLLVKSMIFGVATQNRIRIWDGLIASIYPNLVWSKLWTWIKLNNAINNFGVDYLADRIVCGLWEFNTKVGGKRINECRCDTSACCILGGDDCTEELRLSGPRSLAVVPRKELLALVGPRPGEPRTFKVYFPDSSEYVELTSVAYSPSSSRNWGGNHPIWTRLYFFSSNNDCLDAQPDVRSAAPGTRGIHLEHIMEQNTHPRFFTEGMMGVLPSGRPYPNGWRLSEGFVRNTLFTRYPGPPTAMPGGGYSNDPVERLFNALGSTLNDGQAVFVQAGLNQMKSVLWTQNDGRNAGWGALWYLDEEELYPILEDLGSYESFVRVLRTVISTIHYLADERIWRYLVEINDNVRVEMEALQRHHLGLTGVQLPVLAMWDIFILDLLEATTIYARNFVRAWADRARDMYGSDARPNAVNLLMLVARLESIVDGWDDENTGLPWRRRRSNQR